MTSTSPVSLPVSSQVRDSIARLAAAQPDGRRRVDPTERRRFQALMRNDFLTPRGAPYKWQEITAAVARTVIGGGAPTVVPVRYTWQRVQSRTGTPSAASDPREWTFARGQAFNSVLLHSDIDHGDIDHGDIDHGESNGATVPEASTLGVSYPGLPKSPAVDLLLMLSWDVVTFEMLCTHLATTPALRETGASAELERISGSWANLRFAGPDNNVLFRNTTATGTKLGYGMVDERPTAVYGYRCLDCELTVRSGPMEQDGRSSYWGTVQVDAETGELVVAEMTEMIIAVLTGGDGRQVPVQKRRLVHLWAGDGTGRAVRDAPAPARGAVPGAAPAAHAAPGVGLAGAVPAAEPTPAVLAEAHQQAGHVAEELHQQLGSFDNLPGDLGSMANMGFRSMVGTDLPGAHQRVSELRAGLRAWAGGDAAAGAAVRAALPAHRQTLEGLLAFGQVAAAEATRLDIPEAPSVHRRMADIRPHITDLLALLERIGGTVPPNRRGPLNKRGTS